MFTGLVEDTGVVVELEPGGMMRLVVESPVAGTARVGDSVSVDGVCLTVNETDEERAAFYAMPETLRRTALGRLEAGSVVNLERALGAFSRFGGHIVQGHVDGVGEVLSVAPDGGAGGAEIWEFSAPENVLRYTIEKGSICVSGISLTVVAVRRASFTVSILPQTRESTILKSLAPGAPVNLEADVVAKYVERLTEPHLNRLRKFNDPERSVENAV